VVLVETGVFATKLVPRLRAPLKPMLADSQGPTHAEARTLVSKIEAVSHS
jgi:hypothetical protein